MENENYSKSQIISGILTAIKNKNKSDFNIFDENAYGKKFRDLQSKIPENDTGNTQNQNNLDNILSSLDKEDIDKLFHKAGILAFLYNITKIGNYDFASNLTISTKKRKRKMSHSELEKKAIQYDVALLSAYQKKVDKIMRSEIKDSNVEYTIDDLDDIDYQFINLSIKEKDDVLNLLKNKKYAKLKRQSFFLTIRNLESESNKNEDDTLQEIISKKSVWQSLTTEEKAINDFLDKDKKDKDFKYFEDKVMKKYSENLDFNEFLMKFGEVWKSNEFVKQDGEKKSYIRSLFDIKEFRDSDKEFVRKNNSARTGYFGEKKQHENLLASMHQVYITGVDEYGNLTKWGENDGKLLAVLSKELVQYTENVQIKLIDKYGNRHIFTHGFICGGSKDSYAYVIDRNGKILKLKLENYYKKKRTTEDKITKEYRELKKYRKLLNQLDKNNSKLNELRLKNKLDKEIEILEEEQKQINSNIQKIEKNNYSKDLEMSRVARKAFKILGGAGLFHSALKEAINKSKTVGEAVFNVRMVFENPKLYLTKKCKNNFYKVLKEVLKNQE